MSGDHFSSREVEMHNFEPVEISTKEDLVDFWLCVMKNHEQWLSFDDDQREAAAKICASDSFFEIQLVANGRIQDKFHYFVIKNNGSIIATCKADIEDFRGQRVAYITALSVDEDSRGRGLAPKIIHACEKAAQEEGCEVASLDVDCDNPISLVTNLKEGYRLVKMNSSVLVKTSANKKESSFFVLEKLLTRQDDFDPKSGKIGELSEVNLADKETVNKHLKDGYVGIDIKNIGDPKDNSPENWILILEKK